MEYWDYRVCKKKRRYGLHKVHYDHRGNIVFLTENPIMLCADTERDLEWQFRTLPEALEKPVLDWESLDIVTEEKE